MRKKKGILITAVLACVVALGVGGYALAAQTGKNEVVQETKGGQTILPVLKVTEDLEMVNQEVWEHFVSETKKGNPAGIRVEMVKKLKGNVETISTGVWHNVTFDGKLYHYTSDDMDKTYRYLFRVHGTLPKAASSSTYDVLANEKYSFNEIAKSMYSNNSEDIVDFEFAHF